jgi:hypothetical protein
MFSQVDLTIALKNFLQILQILEFIYAKFLLWSQKLVYQNLPKNLWERYLYNNYSETRNLLGQYPFRNRQSCTENLNAFARAF